MSKALFDDEEPIYEEQEESVPSGIKIDKIFHNDYNTGNLDFEEFGPPKVDQEFVDNNMESYYDSSNYYAKMQNMERVDQFFKDSDFGKLLGMKKKIPKQMIPKLYIHMRDCFEPNEMTESEFFMVIVEYFGASYEIFYENIPAVYRETLVKEMDNKYGILKKRGQRKLF